MVQVQKPEVREALLVAAKQEFLNHGFQLSSTRRIANVAGTTIGNMYKYFKKKDEIFEELVSKAHGQLLFFIVDNHGKLPTDPLLQLQLFVDLMSEYRDEILLLVDASNGTDYQNTFEDLLVLIANNLHEHLPSFISFSEIKDNSSSIILIRTLSVGLLSGMLDILRNHSEKNEIKKGLRLYFMFIFKSFL